jgi:hypothetical protein
MDINGHEACAIPDFRLKLDVQVTNAAGAGNSWIS